MAISCDPSSLANAAKCFESCIPEPQSVKSFLLCQTIASNLFSACCVPNPPFNLHTTGQTDTTISLAWIFLGPCGPDRFTVFWGTVSGVYTNSVTQVGGFLNGFTITGLTPGTTYFINVSDAQKGCKSTLAGEISASTTNCGAVVSGWVARVMANGGAAPSQATQNALCTYFTSLQSAGLATGMKYVVIMKNDNLIAAITPFLNPIPRNDPATNTNFVAGDLGVNGLTGRNGGGVPANATRLDSGVVTSTDLNGQNCGWSTYVYNTTTTGFVHGQYTTNGVAFMGAAHHTDGNAYSYIGATNSNAIAVASAGNGMYSGNRISNVDHRLFFANSLNPPAQIGATDAVAFNGTLVNSVNDLIFAENNAGGVGLQFPCNDTLSIHTIHLGWTLAQFTSEFNASQTLLQTLGGGFR